jgi:SsrA-binding protein
MQITYNKKARFDYFIEDEIESGMVLEGWEVKSLRAGKAQLVDSYVIIKGSEAFLLGCVITPLSSASTHIDPEANRTRKLLLHKVQIDRYKGLIDRKGYTLIALDLHWKKGKAKVSIGIAKGKKMHDKRATIKDREWKRDKERLMKKSQ